MTVFEFETLIVCMVVLAGVGLTMLILVWLEVKWMRIPAYPGILVLAVAAMCGQSVWIDRDSPGLYIHELSAPTELTVTSVALFRVPPGASEVRVVSTPSGQYLVDARAQVVKGQTLYFMTRQRVWGHATGEFACPAPHLTPCWPVERPRALTAGQSAAHTVMNPGRT